MVQAAAETAQQRHDALEEASQAVLSGLREAGQLIAQRKRGQPHEAETIVREPAAAADPSSREHSHAERQPVKRVKHGA